jgi:hypothetical protein
MRYRTSSNVVAGAVAISLFALAEPAYAQADEQRAGARSLATEGAAAFSDGRFKDAVDLFSKAESLVHAPPHLLYLARAHAKLGQFVKAREAYLRITKEQLAPNAPQAFRDAQTAATRELNSVNPKIGTLEIKLEGAENVKDLTIKVDGIQMASVLIGVPQAIDPGEHKVEATGAGFRSQPQTVRLGEGEKTSTTLKLEPDPNAAPAAALATPEAGAAPGASGSLGTPIRDTSSSMDSGTSSSGRGTRIGAYAAFGVGAVGIGVGTVFLLQSLTKRSKADDLCSFPSGACPLSRKPEVDQLDQEADKASTISVVGFAAGGAGVAAGVLLLVLSGKSESSTAGVQPGVYPWVGVGSAGLSGRF